MSSTFSRGTIYCSPYTERLLLFKFKTLKQHTQIRTININQTKTITHHTQEGGTYNVTAFDANHCQGTHMQILFHFLFWLHQSFVVSVCVGSMMFLFEGCFGKVLCTGDFRYCPLIFHPLSTHISTITHCYFDSTFYHPTLQFQTTFQAAQQCEQQIKQYIQTWKIDITKWRTTQLQQIARTVGVNDSLVPDPLVPRIYLCLSMLGSESIISHLYSLYRLPFFVDRSARVTESQLHDHNLHHHPHGEEGMRSVPSTSVRSQEARWHELSSCDLIRGMCTDRAGAFALFHIVDGRGFQYFVQRDRRIRQQAAKQTQYSKCSTPEALYIKPSTLYFVKQLMMKQQQQQRRTVWEGMEQIQNTKSTGKKRQRPLLASFYSSLSPDSLSSCLTSSIPSVVTDRFGVCHVLYSMHCCYDEILSFLHFLRPHIAIPIVTPITYENNTIHTSSHQQFQHQLQIANMCQHMYEQTYTQDGITFQPPNIQTKRTQHTEKTTTHQHSTINGNQDSDTAAPVLKRAASYASRYLTTSLSVPSSAMPSAPPHVSPMSFHSSGTVPSIPSSTSQPVQPVQPVESIQSVHMITEDQHNMMTTVTHNKLCKQNHNVDGKENENQRRDVIKIYCSPTAKEHVKQQLKEA